MNAVSRPWRSFWRRRALRAQDRWLVAVLDRYMGALVSDKPEMSETAGLMASIAQRAHGCQLLILSQAREAGFIRDGAGGWDVHPGVRELPKFMSIERAALRDLGLERRQKPVPSAEDYVAATIAEREAAG